MGAKSLSAQHHVGKTFRFHVPMPPGADSVTVRAVVYDDEGFNSEPAEIVIRRSGAPDVKGALYAVCVGVSKYGNPAYNLKYARQDADAMAGLLERHQMQVISANNGQDAIDIIESTGDLSLVLMDVMMPEMDGYETMRRIRGNPRFRSLPIIALTAKAMKGDREKCLEAGASDYLAKPVNTEQLLSALRMWLHR